MSTQNTKNRLTTILCAISAIFMISSCQKGTIEPQTPVNNIPFLNSANYGNIILQLVDYDVVEITHQAGFDLQSENIYQIEIGKKHQNTFDLIATFPFFFDKEANLYLIHFKLTVALDKTVITFPLTVRYRSDDHSYIDVDTTLALYKYPYSSARIFGDPSRIDIFNYPDIARNDSKFFYHNLSFGCFYEYDLMTHQTIQYGIFTGGEHITANSDYVFCDIDHKNIVRFNLRTKSPDLTFPDIPNIDNNNGMAIQDSSLFILVYSYTGGISYLHVTTLDGARIDSIPYPHYNYFMAVADSILYCKDYVAYPPGESISRFNLKTKTFLPNVRSPVKWLSGLEIYQDTLYYTDIWKRMVGTVPVADLIPVN